MHRGLRIGGASGGGATGDQSSGGPLFRTRPYDGKIAGLYDLEETLGRGHFAVVKLARHVFTGEKVAVKVIDKSKLDPVSKAHLFQEVRCMKLVQHPNVVRLYEVIDTATKLYLILELGDGGDLYEYILRHDTGLPEPTAQQYFAQIVKAISYCHQLHVVHRDLKPENVVFFKKLGIVKLTDFGFSNKFYPGQKLETSCGSLAYSAPEILLGDSYDAPAVDVWSLGVILYMLVCGQPPFQEANDSETLTMIMDCKYNVPAHVSHQCKDLIARMLVRNPEKRATLAEIAKHPWLGVEKQDKAVDVQPLVSKEQLSEEDHNLIVQKIVNGNIATKEEIQESLDKNDYNHITATYYLLAERKLRAKRPDQCNKKRPEFLAVPSSVQSQAVAKKDNGSAGNNPVLLTVPRTPGDLPQRSRKCSIVQEDEEEEDISSCSGREDLGPPLNRRGSRSEGRLNLALQERLAESRKIQPETVSTTQNIPKQANTKQQDTNCGNSNRQTKQLSNSTVPIHNLPEPITTVITDSSTITIPISMQANNTDLYNATESKYRTMPPASPSKQTYNTNQNQTSSTVNAQLNEIFEEDALLGTGTSTNASTTRMSNRQFVRTPYEQRRSKFHKNRTASCSSSDASDDDSEKRKKRAHKLATGSDKPLQGRRDSHDDSSDSQQEPGSAANQNNNNTSISNTTSNKTSTGTSNSGNTGNGGGSNSTNNSSGKQNAGLFGRHTNRHKNQSRRRHGETRLRESQSLNRITEVQEDAAAATAHAHQPTNNTNNINVTEHDSSNSSTVGNTVHSSSKHTKGLGRLLHNIAGKNTNTNSTSSGNTAKTTEDTNKKDDSSKKCKDENCPKKSNQDNVGKKCKKCTCDDTIGHISRKDTATLHKIRLLGKYFQVHKKLAAPLSQLFGRPSNDNNNTRMYKTRSCSSLNVDRINRTTNASNCSNLRAVSAARNSAGDINRNEDLVRRRKSTVVQLNDVCQELTGICATHLGHASKCCSFC